MPEKLKFMVIILTAFLSISISAGCSAKKSVMNVEERPTKQDEAAYYSKDDTGSSFEQYFKLIGLSEKELLNTISEKPAVIDEGGLEFKNTGIRVWFDKESKVNQIYTANKNIEFKGAKIGDPVSKFKEVFGTPISDQNGDIHFKYENIFLSVNYDPDTGQTIAVYILKEDF